MKGKQTALLAASKAFQSQQRQLNSLQSAAQTAAAQIRAGANTPVDPSSHAAYEEKPPPKYGFEALRLIVAAYMLKSRQEILHFRNALVNRTVKAASITELIQNLGYEESRYRKLLAMLPTHLSRDGLLIQSSDLSMILFRSLT